MIFISQLSDWTVSLQGINPATRLDGQRFNPRARIGQQLQWDQSRASVDWTTSSLSGSLTISVMEINIVWSVWLAATTDLGNVGSWEAVVFFYTSEPGHFLVAASGLDNVGSVQDVVEYKVGVLEKNPQCYYDIAKSHMYDPIQVPDRMLSSA
jgi:hypothetical protein